MLDASKAKKADYTLWGRGVHLEATTGKSLTQLRHRAAADRVGLATAFLKSGRVLVAAPTDQFRSAISRFYYSMYHAGRAVVFFQHGGDDHQEHSELPTHLPGDFPDQARWSNDLKSARLTRNRADYDPYPKSEARWKADALQVQANADDFVRVCRKYLRLKGCLYL